MSIPRPCPACDGIAMLSYTDQETGLEIDSCPECFGLWFDSEELRRFFPSSSLAGRILEEDSICLPQAERPANPSERTCPNCAFAMRASPLGEVTLDCCHRCLGIWLDHGELKRIVEEYRAGRRGNIIVLNQLAEGLRSSQPTPGVRAACWVLGRE